MKKGIVLFIAIIVFIALAFPVKAETIFNQASKCIAGWGKASAAPAAQPKAVESKKACCCTTTDVLGNKVSCKTVMGGKSVK